MTTLKTGSVLQNGKYRIESVLGQGGFGITYLATQTSLGRKVTVKEFFMKELCNRDETTSQVSVPSTGSRDTVARFRKKFVKEAQTIATLDNAHIVRIHDVFEENGTAYYVMDYISGGSLSDRVKRYGALDVATAVDYTLQVAEALDYIHRRRINHLDIKPGNILVGGNGQAVVIDFGLSKRYDDNGSQTSTTPVGISHGYAPLEQYQPGGVSTFSPQADIYALGATLFYLLTAVTPQAATMLLSSGFPASELTSRHVPSKVVEVVRKAMSTLPQDRYQSIGEMTAALSEAARKAVKPRHDSRRHDSDEATVIGVDGHPTDTAGDTRRKAATATGGPTKWLWKQAAFMAVAEIVAIMVWTGCTSAFSFWEGLALIWHGYSSPDMPEVYFTIASWGLVALLAAAIGWCVYRTRNVFLHFLARWAAIGFVCTFRPFSWTYLPEGWCDSYTAFFALALLSVFAFALPLKLEEGSVAKTLKRHRGQAIVAAVVYAFPIFGCCVEGSWILKDYNNFCVKPVDLGLSVEWAPIGADAEDAHDPAYSAFGFIDNEQVTPRNLYFFFFKNLQAPCQLTLSSFGLHTDGTLLRNWGQGWRLPTKEEMQGLIDNCTWEWWEDRWINSGYCGYRVTGKNGRQLFLKAEGAVRYEEGETLRLGLTSHYDDKVAGYYLTGDITRGADGRLYANYLHFKKPKDGKNDVILEQAPLETLYDCMSIRPVHEK